MWNKGLSTADLAHFYIENTPNHFSNLLLSFPISFGHKLGWVGFNSLLFVLLSYYPLHLVHLINHFNNNRCHKFLHNSILQLVEVLVLFLLPFRFFH